MSAFQSSPQHSGSSSPRSLADIHQIIQFADIKPGDTLSSVQHATEKDANANEKEAVESDNHNFEERLRTVESEKAKMELDLILLRKENEHLTALLNSEKEKVKLVIKHSETADKRCETADKRCDILVDMLREVGVASRKEGTSEKRKAVSESDPDGKRICFEKSDRP